MDLGAMELRRQGFALGLAPGRRRFAGELFELLGHRSQVGFDRFLEQLGLLRRQALRLDPQSASVCAARVRG